jgi:hypothetical protein
LASAGVCLNYVARFIVNANQRKQAGIPKR